jgi:hypothetical protein
VGKRVALDAFPDFAFGRSDLGPQFLEKGLREEVANHDEAIPMKSLSQRGVEQAPQEQAAPPRHQPRKEKPRKVQPEPIEKSRADDRIVREVVS